MYIAEVLDKLGFSKGESPCGKMGYFKSVFWGNYFVIIIPEGSDNSLCTNTQAEYLVYNKEKLLLVQNRCANIFEAIRNTLLFTNEDYITELTNTS